MPKMRWHPVTGENQTFADEESAPEGWLDHHPADPAHAKPAEPVVPAEVLPPPEKPLTGKELVVALTEGGIVFDKNAKVAELDALLRDALVAALTKAAVPFDTDASTRALLTLAKG